MQAHPQLLKVDAEITSWNYMACAMQVRVEDYTGLISGLKIYESTLKAKF